ncbi:MAG: LamG-like jellyroll fold domain-containing protein [Candidatus Hatepunaea meridiana]|nr:LamG-like jellyroll fold domain-containing protein [Candidatus Hatepunaea meridiana]
MKTTKVESSYYQIRLILLIVLCMLPTVVFGQAGTALSFDGRNTYALIPRNDVLNCENITLEVWIKPQQCIAGDRWDSILNKPYTQHAAPHYQWLLSRHQNGNANMIFTINGQASNARTEEGLVDLNEWCHLAGSYNGEVIRIYFNGELAGETDVEGRITGYNTDLSFGRLGNVAVDKFNGIIEEVRVWNYARNEEQIQQTMNVALIGDEEGLIGYWKFDEGEGQVITDSSPEENNGRLGANNGQDAADPRWVESDAPIYGGTVSFSAEFIEFGPIPQDREREAQLVMSNTSERDVDWYNVEFTLTNIGEDPNWLGIEPEEGIIEVGDEAVITLTASTNELDPGEYERTIRFEANAANVQQLDIPVTMIVTEGAGRLYGVVTNAETNAPIEGALIQVIADFDLSTTTDEEGRYDFEETPTYTYHLLVTAEDYLPIEAEEVEVGADEEVELNFELLHSEFIPDPVRIERSLAPDEELEVALNITNNGNGPLTWSVERIFPEGGQAEPWELREDVNVQVMFEDNQVNGVAFAEGHFYVSSGNNREDVNKIYVLDSEFDPVRQFDQFHESDYGMRDLCWDGELIWGADESIIYGFTTGGQLVTSIEGEASSYRSLTWDPDHNLFWSANVTSDIFATNLDGELVREIERPGDVRMYGLAYWSDDPDGYNLYIFSRGEETDIQVSKLNLENGDAIMVTEFDFNEGRPGGICITNRWDPYSWVLTGIVQNDDHLAIWHLESRSDWMILEPVAGVIQADESEDLTVTLNSEGFPGQTDLSADLLFTHDGVDGSYELPVALSVTGVGGMAQRMLSLNIGWNLVSVNVEPEENDIPVLFEPLVEEDLLIIIKDQYGHFFVPEYEFGQFFWHGTEGYLIKMARRAELLIEGEVLAWDTEIALEDGWNMVSYLPRVEVEAVSALSNLGNALELAKDGLGHFYIPEWEFSNIGLMREGQGYQLMVDGDVVLVYNIDDGRLMSVEHSYTAEETAWLNAQPISNSSFSLLLLADGLEAGARLEAYTPSGVLAGRGIVDAGGRCGMSLWGTSTGEGGHSCPPPYKNPTGFNEGDPISIKSSDSDLSLKWLDGTDQPLRGSWTNNGWGVARVTNEAIPIEFGIHKTYPNPFNGQLRIEFAVETKGNTTLKAYNLNGREIANITSDIYKAGLHSTIWNAEALPSGLYIIKLSSKNQIQTKKVVLVK